MNRKVIQGSMGWTDPTIHKCRRYYPPNIKSNVEKLAFFSRNGEFGCIEVDSSSYTILDPKHIKSWVDCTPKDFIFHFKAFGIFCHGQIDRKFLPTDIKSCISTITKTVISLEDLGPLSQELWDRFNSNVMIAYNAKKLGCVVFQFQSNFSPSEKARKHLEYIARQLYPQFEIAVDFRNRKWIDKKFLESTISFLSTLRPGGVALVASDDLISEMGPAFSRYGQTRGTSFHSPVKSLPTPLSPSPSFSSSPLLSSQNAEDDTIHVNPITDPRLQILLTALPCPRFAFIRVHRRVGTERELKEEEIREWVHRLECLLQERLKGDQMPEREAMRGGGSGEGEEDGEGEIRRCNSEGKIPFESPTRESNILPSPSLPSLVGPIYFLWGTDHEDQPVLNARRLQRNLPPSLQFDWKAFLKRGGGGGGEGEGGGSGETEGEGEEDEGELKGKSYKGGGGGRDITSFFSTKKRKIENEGEKEEAVVTEIKVEIEINGEEENVEEIIIITAGEDVKGGDSGKFENEKVMKKELLDKGKEIKGKEGIRRWFKQYPSFTVPPLPSSHPVILIDDD